MHIETLKVFCDVVETRSFSTAASQNFVTQSAVSQQIRALETKYDCKLVERTRGAVQVTPAGEVVYQASKEIVQRYLEMESGIQSLNNRVGGTLRIATVYSVGLYELSSPLRRFCGLSAGKVTRLQPLDEIQEDVLRGSIDFGIVAYAAKRPHLVILPFREDRLALICHPQHPLARTSRSRSEDPRRGRRSASSATSPRAAPSTARCAPAAWRCATWPRSTTSTRSSASSRSGKAWRSCRSRRCKPR